MKRCISRLGASGAEGITVLLVISTVENFRIVFRQVSGNATRKCELWPGSCVLCSICFRMSQSRSTPWNTTATPSPGFSSFPGPKKTFIFANHWNPGIWGQPKQNVKVTTHFDWRCYILPFGSWGYSSGLWSFTRGRIFIFMASPIFRFVISNRVEASFVDSAAGAHEIGCAERLSLGVAWAKGTVMWR